MVAPRKPNHRRSTDPAARARREAVGGTYNEHSAAYDGFHNAAKDLAENRFVGRTLSDRIGADDEVIDLGCGTGLLLEIMPVDPAKYTGVDISAGMLEIARDKHPRHRFVQGDMARGQAELADGCADYVVSLFGSPSYCDLERVQRQVMRLLKPGGRFFMMFCGPRYPQRGSYINRAEDLLKPASADQVQSAYPSATLWGMSVWIDHLPERSPPWIFDLWSSLEVATLGQLWYDRCYFIVAEGAKPATMDDTGAV